MKKTTPDQRRECGIFESDGDKWNAVLSHAREADGKFVYAVRSTGIYCRPSCGSRRPGKIDAVKFFGTTSDAEDAGYRACLRCRPDRGEADWQAGLLRVQEACRILEQEPLKKSISLDNLAEELGISPAHLQKSFRKILGISPKQYRDAVRLRKFRAMLGNGKRVLHAAREAGLHSPGVLYGNRMASPGIHPSDYLAGSPGVEMHFAVAPCPLGVILVAATEKGVCSVRIGDDAEGLEGRLAIEFPQAIILPGQESLGPFLLAVLSVVGENGEESSAAMRLPLDIRGTAYQWRVWMALREIEPGMTLSYRELANRAGGGPRAAGSACGANPVALAIPCHRAIHSDGTVSGYRWGRERKIMLLEHEEKIRKTGPR